MKTLIGLEIHVELKTNSKMFCGCKNEFGAIPNSNVCEVCLGHPGTLPLLNKEAIRLAVMAGLAFNCTINKKTKMDRKKYFYPDLVKGFQISQDDKPLCSDGYIEIDGDGGQRKKIRIERIHIEEDTGKSSHTEAGHTLMDFNRSGVPLIEIVSKPDISSAKEAQDFLDTLRQTLLQLGISDVKMAEGSMRCDVNINLVDEENSKKTGIAEIKNLNSFRAITRSIEHEEKRQKSLFDQGEVEDRNTRRWDDTLQETVLMRMKDDESDYRYTVEPSLPHLLLSEDFIQGIEAELPELPREKYERLIDQYKIDPYDADILSRNPGLADYFEESAENSSLKAQVIANWINSDLTALINEEELSPKEIPIPSKEFVLLLSYVGEGKINTNTGKKLLREIFIEGGEVEKIIKDRGLVQVSDESALQEIVDRVLGANPQSIEDYKSGKDNALKYLMGQCMKESRGKGNPQIFNQMLLDYLTED